jgi:polyphosphate kinase
MLEDLDRDELTETPLEQAFQTLFPAHEYVPTWLYDPARPLALAEAPARSAEQRIADLAHMSQESDRIFREHLPSMHVVDSHSQTSNTSWPVTLARWIELLNYRAAMILEREIRPELASKGFYILPVAQVAERNDTWLQAHFQQHIYPLLTPLAVDPGRPFPYISSDSLNLLVELNGGNQHHPTAMMARVKIPSITPRLIRLPQPTALSSPGPEDSTRPATLVYSIDLVRHYVSELFVSIPIRRVFCFRVLRGSEMVGPTQPNMEDMRGRKARGSVVRVDVQTDMPRPILDWLVDHLDVISYAVVHYGLADMMMSLPQLAEAVANWRRSG